MTRSEARSLPPQWRATLAASILVAGIVGAALSPVLHAKALALDDDLYVTENALVNRPSVASTVQFFREALKPTTIGGYWMPLSMTSLMLDVAVGGSAANPQPFHRTSLALHIVATIALLWMLVALFGEVWPATLAALAFGVHPLVVEPIAWIGERKTVLAGALVMMAAATHVGWVRTRARHWRWSSIGLFALALMSKPTATPLPLLLLLLDIWPLRRLNMAAVVEKWPLAALAAASTTVSLISHASTGTMTSTRGLGLPLELAAKVVFYVGKVIRPLSLACVYPDLGPFSWSRPALIASLVAVAALTAIAVREVKKGPALLVCWFWFLFALSPVLGLVHYSWVELSDKYVYLALPTIALGLTGVLSLAFRAATFARVAVMVVMLALIGAETGVSRMTIENWRDSETLWRHIVTVSPSEAGALNGLGGALVREKKWAEARRVFERAVRLDSTFWMAHLNVAMTSMELGDLPAAQAASARTLALMPGDPDALYEGAVVALGAGQLVDAERMLRGVISVRPFDAGARLALARTLDLQGRRDESISELRRALELQPGTPAAEFGLGQILALRDGFTAEARGHLEVALRANPHWVAVLNELAWGLATANDSSLRDGPRALQMAMLASRLSGDSIPQILDTRAAAEAANGRFTEATSSMRQAIARATHSRADSLVRGYEARLAHYGQRRPWIGPRGIR